MTRYPAARYPAAIVLLALLAAQPAPAGSVFSVNGIGETIFGVDARGMAMGGAGLADPTPWHISLENPALLARVERFSFGAALMPELRRIELEGSDKSASFAYFPFFRLTHSLPGNLVAGAAMGVQHRVSYRTEERRTVGDLEVVDVRSGDGGPNFVSFALARKIGARALVGAELRIMVGTIEDRRNVSAVGDTMLATQDVIKTSFGGEPLGRFGGYVDLGGGLGIGGAFQFSRVMDVTTTVISRGVELARSEADITYPAMGGLGVSYKPGQRATFTAEWFRTAWGETGALAGYDGEMVDSNRFSFGAEWVLGGDDYKVPLRAGFLRRELSYRASGAADSPTETALTLGMGLPFRRDNGSFDVAVQIGSRGDLETDGARESFLRFTLSMVGTEFLEHLIPGAE